MQEMKLEREMSPDQNLDAYVILRKLGYEYKLVSISIQNISKSISISERSSLLLKLNWFDT